MHKPIQIVDELGFFLGVVPSPKHALMHNQVRLVSRVVLQNSKGQYLLQKRAENMFVYPGRWDSSAAGHVDEGENPEQAAARELFEEVGLEGIDLIEVARYYTKTTENNGYISRIFNHVFLGVYDGPIETLQLDPSEVSEVRWFTSDDVSVLLQNKSAVTEGLISIFTDVL